MKDLNKRPNFKTTFALILLLTITLSIFASIPSTYAVEWSPDMRITWDSGDDQDPKLAQRSDGKIWFVWHSRRTGDYEIYCKIYDPSKVNPWSPDTQLTATSGIDMTPSVMHAADGRTWVAWTSRRTGNYEIYYKTYDGSFWSLERNLSNNQSDDASPSLLQTTNGTIWVFWASKRTGNNEIYYKKTNDNGDSWSIATQITFTTSLEETETFVTQSSDGKIWLVFAQWSYQPYKDRDIHYKTCDGLSWSADGTITSDPGEDMHPSIAQATDGKIWVVWDSDRILGPDGPQNDIFYDTYNGISWSGNTQLTTNTSEDDMPCIIRANDGVLWVTWSAFRQGYDIFYRTSSLPLPHDVAIFNVAPYKKLVSQNKTLTIGVVAQNHGTNTETFTISLYRNTTLIGSKQVTDLIAGELYATTFIWNTTGVPLGNYTIMANATIVAGETNTGDNTYVYGLVPVVRRDVGVVSITPTSTRIYKEISWEFIRVDVVVKNEGTTTEDITVAAYCNSTNIGIQTIPTGPGSYNTALFTLDTTDLYGYYELSAEVYEVPDEVDPYDNHLHEGSFVVSLQGDVNYDRNINLLDWSSISAHWYPGPPLGPLDYDWRIDIDQEGDGVDGVINMIEVSVVSAQWGQSW